MSISQDRTYCATECRVDPIEALTRTAAGLGILRPTWNHPQAAPTNADHGGLVLFYCSNCDLFFTITGVTREMMAHG